MKFNLVDKIEQLTDDRIIAVKQVSLAEEYLADHFPTFPVLPGVMMVEAMTQAAGWLLHSRRSFSKSMVVLKEARHVKYGRFVAPGDWLRIEAEYMKETETGALFRASGTVGSSQAVSARLELAYFDLADKNPALSRFDGKMKRHTMARFEMLQTATMKI